MRERKGERERERERERDYMLFCRKTIRQNPRLTINNVNIERIQEAKFLGVIPNEKLSWSAHIKAPKTKIARYIGIMYRIKNFIPLQVRV